MKRALALLIVLLVVAIYLLSRLEYRYIFVPHMKGVTRNPLDAVHSLEFKHKIREVNFNAQDGTRLNGWYIPATTQPYTILYAHGNGGNMGFYWQIAQTFTDEGYGFFALDYRGYGKSMGSPSENGLYSDYEGASHFLETEYHIPVTHQIAVGSSLGGAVVLNAATHLPFEAVMTVSAFTSIPAATTHLRAHKMLGLLNPFPVEFFIQQRFDSLSRIARVMSPLVVVHGLDDRFIPPEMGVALFQKAKAPCKKLVLVDGASHNDIFYHGRDQVLAALHDVIECKETR